MSKKKSKSIKKQRNKSYSGADSKTAPQKITRVKATKKHPIVAYLQPKLPWLKRLTISIIILSAIIYSISLLLRWIF